MDALIRLIDAPHNSRTPLGASDIVKAVPERSRKVAALEQEGTTMMAYPILSALAVLLTLGCGSPQALAATIGSQFRANTYVGSQVEPSVAGLANGGFVAAWISQNGQDGAFDGIYAQRFSAAGAKAGIEFKVNTYTPSYQSYPSVAALDDGGFIIVWDSYGQDSDAAGIYGQRYSGTGAKVGTEFRVNTFRINNQNFPSVDGLADGGFVVIWRSYGQDGDLGGIYGQRYSSTSARAGNEFRVNTVTAREQSHPSVSRLRKGGGFVVTWQSKDENDFDRVYVQRFSAAGTRTGAEFPVDPVMAGSQQNPSVAGLNNGGFVVTWDASPSSDVYGQRYDAAGARAGGRFRANVYANSYQSFPSVATLSNGDFVIAWSSDGQDGSGYGVYGSRFTAWGARVGSEFRANTGVAKDQIEPSVASLGNGNYVIVWRLHNGSTSGIYGQRFGP
jgi:hypothetical protein